MALGLAFASVLAAGRVSVAAAKFDEGTSGSRYVAAGGWSGQVDMESGIPLSAGIPHGDEQFLDSQAVQVIPYLSHGMLTEAEARAASLATAEAIHDPYLTDLFVRPGESLGGPDGEAIAFANAIQAQSLATAEAIHDPYVSPGVLGEAVKTNVADVKFVPGVTDFPTTPQPTPDNRIERALEQGPPVISYLSHGMTADDVTGLRPDDRGDRFAHSDVPAPVEVSSSGSTIEWNEALTVGIGALVLALGLGLALGYLRRPRLAGL
jgi:hypothetical protein